MTFSLNFILHLCEHTLIDIFYLMPYLYATYLILEYIEHHAHNRIYRFIQSANRLGPLYGALTAPISGCGLSVAAANFYATRLISIGTMIAVFLATADDMLPMLISAQIKSELILRIMIFKIVFAVCIGFILDNLLKKKKTHFEIQKLCRQEQCNCHHVSIFKSAWMHTVCISGFIFIVSFLLNIAFEIGGTQFLNDLIHQNPIGSILISTIAGIIPNCAVSIALTQLYIDHVLPDYALIAGSFSNAGVGLLVFYKSTRSGWETVKIIGLLFGCSIIGGIIAKLIF